MRSIHPGLAAAPLAALAVLAGAGSAAAEPMVTSAPNVALHTSAPPTTATCQASFGINCYSPQQLRSAYDLGPLYAAGDRGAGRTIAIVDSFGSPTITQDLAKFDADFGLSAPP